MFEEGFLKLDGIHTMYYTTTGNKSGLPILFVHGGPGGSGDILKCAENIDLNKFYCITYDQRGCGKSLPSGELRENNKQNLIDDIIKLLDHLNIEKAIFSATSWGACLSLQFAIAHPERVEKMFLGSTFLARRFDSEWLFYTSKAIFPDLYEKFMIPIISNEKEENMARYLLDKMEKGNIEEKKKMACYISNYEYGLMLMSFSNSTFRKPEDFDEKDIIPTRIFLHFEANHFFMEENYIINNADKIKNIPINFYHGRFDMDCTLDTVYELHKKLPNSKLVIVPYESHKGILLNELRKRDINDC